MVHFSIINKQIQYKKKKYSNSDDSSWASYNNFKHIYNVRIVNKNK